MNTEQYLLIKLSEECIEVSKDIHKSLTFGLQDVNILEPDGPNNLRRVLDELNDLMATIELMIQKGIIPRDWKSHSKQEIKIAKIQKFMQYSKDEGILN